MYWEKFETHLSDKDETEIVSLSDRDGCEILNKDGGKYGMEDPPLNIFENQILKFRGSQSEFENKKTHKYNP